MMNDQIDDYGIYDYSIGMMKMIKLIFFKRKIIIFSVFLL